MTADPTPTPAAPLEPRGCPTPGACSCPTPPIVPPELIRALEVAEAALREIDAGMVLADDLACCPRLQTCAAQTLPKVRHALQTWREHATPLATTHEAAPVPPQGAEISDEELTEMARAAGMEVEDDSRERVLWQAWGDELIAFARAIWARAREAEYRRWWESPGRRRPVSTEAGLAHDAYIAFVQICKGNSDDAGTYDSDEKLVRRALQRLSELEQRATLETEQEIETEFRLWWKDRYGSAYCGAVPLAACIEWTRHAVSRYARPAIDCEALEERFEQWWHNEGSTPPSEGRDWEEHVHCMTRIAWHNGARPAIQPVPVSERPWERPPWCDAEGRCWVRELESDYPFGETGDSDVLPPKWKLTDPTSFFGSAGLIFLLPHWALPLPAADQPVGRDDG